MSTSGICERTDTAYPFVLDSLRSSVRRGGWEQQGRQSVPEQEYRRGDRGGKNNKKKEKGGGWPFMDTNA